MSVVPPAGFYPFWFWNDTLSADEVRWQVAEMADKGVRGFYIHSRQGLGQPYLSEAFFEMVDVAVEAAEEHGLTVHLYDEYPYPSGVAGGEVILGRPRYYATRLVQESYVIEGGQVRLELPRGRILSCIAYPRTSGQTDWGQGIDLRGHVGVVLKTNSYLETGLTRYNRKRYFASEPTPMLEVRLGGGTYELFVSAQVQVDHVKYWSEYVDVLDPAAIQQFIALTHERYRERYADKFGHTILSIFTDETEPRWSERVPAAFLDKYGYDLCNAMPALQDSGHPDHVRVSYDLYRLLYEMFCQAFEEPISSWCQRNGLAYAGEKPSLRLAQLRYMDVPGCEPGHTKVGTAIDLLQSSLRGNAKATASAAHFYGKQGALCECYHSTGWSATLQDAKFIADGLLLMGIRYLVPHGFFYSTHALRKHDAPPTFFFQMPFWPMFGRLAARVDRIGDLFEGTHIDADLLLVDPASGIPTRRQRQTYEAIHRTLMALHLDYHVVDTDILEQSRVEEGRVHIAGLAAKAVVVPPMRVVEEPLQAWLNEYAACGGTVLHCGDAPSGEALSDALASLAQPSLSVQADGTEAGAVLVVKRAGREATRWFVLNTSAESVRAELRSGGGLREIPLEDGLPAFLEWDGDRYLRTLRPFESFLLEATESFEAPEKVTRIAVPVGGRAKLRVAGQNLLRMYDWRMSLLNGEHISEQSALVQAVPLANQLEQGRFRYMPAYEKYFGHAPELAFPEFAVRYEFSFGCAYDGAVHLVVEPGSIAGDWTVYVNEAGPLSARDLKPVSAHVRGSLGVEITDQLVQGENVLRVEVREARPDGGLLNPLYLAGDFGVMLHPLCLVPRSDEGLFEDYEGNLLPYYAGVLEYDTEFILDHLPEADHVVIELDYGGAFHEATEVSINGGQYVPVLWEPRCVQLSRHRLRAGANTVRTRVYTTLIRAFEGQWFDYGAHRYRDVGEKADEER